MSREKEREDLFLLFFEVERERRSDAAEEKERASSTEE